MTASKEYKKTIAQLKRHRTAELARLVTKYWSLKKKGKETEASTLICNTFVDLGGVYVKFLQGVLLRSSMMKRWQTGDKLKIFENLESEPVHLQSILQSELTPQQLSKIASIQPQPFAAGSFGQVYFGQLKDGTYVVIKLLRPMVRDTLKYDLKLLGIFMKNFTNKLYPNMTMDTKGIVDDFKRSTIRETDYAEEATFANEMYEIYKDHKTIKIPKTYLELCSPNLIIQEYIDGLSVAQVVRLKEQGVNVADYVKEQTGSDIDKQLISLGFECLYGAFKYPRIMGDPHPGNIRLMENNRVGIIDFGISAKSPDNPGAFYALLKQYQQLIDGKSDIASLFGSFIRFFVSDLYTALKKVSALIPGTERVDILKTIGEIAEKTFQKEMPNADFIKMAQDGSIIKIVNRVVNKQNRFGLVMKVDETEILRASQTYLTLVEALDRREQVLPTAYKTALEQVNLEFPEFEHAQESRMSMGHALDIVSNWLERIADRDPSLFTELRNKISVPDIKEKISKASETDDIVKEEGAKSNV